MSVTGMDPLSVPRVCRVREGSRGPRPDDRVAVSPEGVRSVGPASLHRDYFRSHV